MGGVVPLGYRVEDRRLLVELAEAETVQLIFARYQELKSLPALQRNLRDRGIVTRVRDLATGRRIGGVPLTNGPLVSILRNRTYLGEINHRGASYPGQHKPIIEQSVFEDVQAILDANRRGRRDRWRSSDALLLGKLYDDRGNRMTPSYVIKKGGVRYRYYISCVLAQGRKSEAGSVPRVAASEVEDRVRDALVPVRKLGDAVVLMDGDDGRETSDALFDRVERVIISPNEIRIELSGDDDASESIDPIRVPWAPPRRSRYHGLIPSGQDGAGEKVSGVRRTMKGDVRARMIVAIANAKAWLDQLVRSEVPDIGAIARRERRSERSVRMTLTLAFLAPDVVEAIVRGTLSPGFGLTDLTDLPMDWAEQRRSLGLC